MARDESRIRNSIRDVSPCKGCAERFTACSDRCPKDARGEYGHKAWKAEIKRVKDAKEEYLKRANIRSKQYYGGGSYGKE